MRFKKIKHPAIVAQSLIDNRIYVDADQYNESIKLMFLDKKIILSKKLRFFPYTKLKSEAGYCSAPYGNYTARHCICPMCQRICKGEKAELLNNEKATTEVIKCSKPKPLWNKLLCAILEALGYSDVELCGELDWCLLTKSNSLDGQTLLGVLSAAPIDGSFAIFSPFDIDECRDRQLLNAGVESISYDFETDQVVHWKGILDDIVMAYISDGKCLVQLYGYVVKPLDKITIKPGYSGSPLLLSTR